MVHSFLYYVLDESLISDAIYDSICKELVKYKTSPVLQYPDIIKHLDESGSGYYIKKYPEAIISKAIKLLYQHKVSEGMTTPFPNYVKRKGFKILD